MKTKLHAFLVAVFLLSLPILNFAQAPDLKTCADFILFTSTGGITNTGVSQILGGAVGTDFGALTGFDDVNCVQHIQNTETAQCKLDLQAVYDEISAIDPTETITAASLNGGTITPGIYQINEAVALTINLTLDAQDISDALFIFKVTGAISTAASVNIILVNGASVNNVFWHGTAAIGAGADASLKGTFMTNAGAIALGAGALLEGRALTVIGEVTISGSTLTGCIMPELTTATLTQPTYEVATGTIEVTAPLGAGITYSTDGYDFTNTSGLFTHVPGGEYTVTSKNSDGCISWTDVTLTSYVHTPTLGTTADFILFTSSGGITNTGVSHILGGAVGTDFGTLTGFDDVSCVQHIQNDETAQCKLDLQTVYDEISAIVPTATITAASLNGGTITPGIYEINEAVALTIDLILDAQNNPEALFIFKVTGAISTAASVNILLINGASVNNIFWQGTAAIGAGASASLKGTFMTNAGAIALGAGAILEGRALTVIGEVTISGSTLTGCIMPVATTVTLTQPSCSVATGTIEVTAPLGAGMTYSIDGSDFTNTSGIFTDVSTGNYTVTSKNTDGCLSKTNITLTGVPHPPELGTVTDFVLFTSAGAVGNTGVSSITGGAIGTDFGAITGFEAIECEKHTEDVITAQCKLDLQATFDEIDALEPTAIITAASLSGGTITPGIYHINSAAAVSISLTLNAENDPNALFIFKVTGAFSLAASVEIILINGASVNNVFWNVDGAVSAGAGATLRGVFLALAGTISLGEGSSLEGRALSIAGAIDILNSTVSVCIKPNKPIITITQPNCSQTTGTITITSPAAAGMTYRIDYCAYSNTTGIFSDLDAGTYLVSAKNAEGCISDGTTVIINEESSDDITWTGTVSNDWNTIENWDLNDIPGPYCNVIIPGGGLVNQTSDTPAVSKGLSIGTSAILTIGAGKTLTVNENLTIGTDAILLGAENLTVIGTTRVERSLAVDSWQYLTPAIIGAKAGNIKPTTTGQFAYVAEYENTKIGSSGNDYNDGWTFLTNENTDMSPGKGYAVQVSGAKTVSFEGPLLASDQTISGITTGDAGNPWVLIGNPFTAHLDWKAISGDADITGVAYIYSPSFASENKYGSINSDGQTLNEVGSEYIPPMQGFFVEASGSENSQLTIPLNALSYQTQSFYKSETVLRNYVRMAIVKDNYADEALVYFTDKGENSFNPISDGRKFEMTDGTQPLLYTLAEGHKVSYNILGEWPISVTVAIYSPVSENLTLQFTEVFNLDEDLSILLEDKLTGKVYDISEQNKIEFNAIEGESDKRFVLHFTTHGATSNKDIDAFNALLYITNNILVIEKQSTGNARIDVFNMLGQIVLKSKIAGAVNRIETFIPDGIYLVRLTSPKGIYTQKVIKK